MGFDALLQYWPVVVGVALLTMLGFLRVLSGQIKQQVEVHNTARQAAKMRIDFIRHRREQLERQKELASK
ncbi:MAG: hypothetical protein WC058_00395 [Phycisphaeraceae bacterium]